MYISDFVHPLICGWTCMLLRLLAIVKNAAISLGVQGCKSLLPVLLGTDPQVEVLAHMIILFKFLKLNEFLKRGERNTFSTENYQLINVRNMAIKKKSSFCTQLRGC